MAFFKKNVMHVVATLFAVTYRVITVYIQFHFIHYVADQQENGIRKAGNGKLLHTW